MTSRDRKRKHEDGYSDVEPKRKKLAGTCTGTETQRLDPILHMTLDSSREAKTPSRDKKRKREESHVEAAPKGRKLAGSENTTRRLDPILHLNPDVINTILDLLPLADAIKCQALSKPWKNTVQDWMTTSRARIGKQLHPYPGRSISPSIWAGLTESEIKRHASIAHNLQNANATSFIDIRGTDYVSFAGNFCARREVIAQGSSDTLRWETIKPEKNQANITSRPLVAPFLNNTRRALAKHAAVVQLQVNAEGLILLDVLYPRLYERWAIVHSPLERRSTFERRIDYTDENTCILGLGRTRVYIAERNRAPERSSHPHDIVAYNLASGDQLYRITPPSATSDWCGVTLNAYLRRQSWDRKDKRGSHSRSVVYGAGNEELPIMTSGTDVDYLNFNPSTVQLNQTEIIRGSDGKIVHTILFSPSRTQPCVTDPVTGEVYFIWSPCEYQLYSILKDHPVFEKYTAIVIRAFNYDPSDTEEQRTSDARVIFYDETKSRSQIIHPMAMVSIAFEPTPSSKSKEVLRIKRRPCVPTKDAAFNQAASAVVEHLFPTEDVAVAGCFKLGQAKAVSDPVLSSNGDGRQKRAKIEINHQEKTDLYLIDAESVLVRSRSGSALVNFG